MKKILAIGGAVIKTDLEDVIKLVKMGEIEMLIHNGASIFHDFQIAMDMRLIDRGITSYPLKELEKDFGCNEKPSIRVDSYLRGKLYAPVDSLTHECHIRKIPVLMFTALGCDFWQLFNKDWRRYGRRIEKDFEILCERMRKPFHYILMGSAVIHPEVFEKAKVLVKPKDFKCDVVDFKDMYRPRTRVAIHGKYYKMSHKEFTQRWIKRLEKSSNVVYDAQQVK